LKLNTLFLGRNIVRLDNVKSTNDFALDMLRESKVLDGTVIVTDKQTQGKGQRGNKWIGDANLNLTCSIVLFPKCIRPSNQFILSKIVALGIVDFLMEVLGTKVLIKWPNDIYVGEDKIGGILIENTITSNLIKSSVIGIGLNINQTQFPNSIANATSMKTIAGKEFRIEQVMCGLCDALEARYLSISKTDVQNEDYLRFLKNMGELVKYRFRNEIITAAIKGVSETGELILERDNGEVIKCANQEIKLIS